MSSGNPGPCPSQADLLAAAEAPVPSGALSAHVGTCAACQGTLRRMQGLLGVLNDLALEPVPEHVLAAALAVPAEAPGLEARIRSFVARLLPAPAGDARPAFRGASGATTLAYEAGPYQLELSHLASGALVGRVSAREGELTQAGCLLYGGFETQACELGTGGRFRFTDVEPGDYVLIVESEDRRVVVPGISLERD